MIKQIDNEATFKDRIQPTPYRVGELFAGIGGIGRGFQKAGFEIVWANEIDTQACITYAQNFTHLVINEDMQEVDAHALPKIDVLTGGFPCQAFSVAGYRRGFKDSRVDILPRLKSGDSYR